jgi:hypothetical protein
VGVHWYDGAEGSADPQAPVLAIAFHTGKVQLSRAVDDERPLMLESKLHLSQVRPNPARSTHRAPANR